ncbi:MAG: hypothetical protein R3Y53_09395 [Bacillota bacterium]
MKKLTKLERKKKFASVLALLMALLLVLSMAAPLFAVFATEPTENSIAKTNTVSSQLETFGEELFQFSVEIGFDNQFLVQHPIDISGTLTSTASDFQGQLLTKSYINAETYIENYIDLDIKQGVPEPFSTEAMYFERTDFIEIQIKNTKDELVYQNYFSATPFSQHAKIIGILSDDVEALSYLGTLSPTSTTELVADKTLPLTMVVPFSTTSFIGNFEALSSLIIDNYDLNQLSEEFLIQLELWVENGGTLLISPEGTALPLVSELEETDPLTATFVNFSEEPFLVSSYTHPDLEILMGLTRAVLFSALDIGLGSVIVCHSSLSEFPLKDNPFTNVAIENYLIRKSHDNFVSTTSDSKLDHTIMSPATVHLPYDAVADDPFLIYFFGGYILLLAPFSYFLLKKFDKREFAWCLLPIFSLVFFGLNTYMAQTTSFIKGYVLAGEYIALQEGEAYTKANTLLQIYPSQLHSNSHFTSSYSFSPFVSATNEDVADGKLFSVNTGITGTDLTYAPTTNDAQYALQGNYRVDTGGSLQFNIEMTETGFKGTIKNDTLLDFPRAYVMIAQDAFVALGEVKSGETISISKLRHSQKNESNDTPISLYDFADEKATIRTNAKNGTLDKTDAYFSLMELDLLETILKENSNKMPLAIEFFGFATQSPLNDDVALEGELLGVSTLSLYHQVGTISTAHTSYFEMDLPIDYQKTMKSSNGNLLPDAYDTTLFFNVEADGMYTFHYTVPDKELEVLTMQLIETTAVAENEYSLQSGRTFDLYNRYDDMWESISLRTEINFDLAPYINTADNTLAMRGVFQKGETSIPTFTVRGGTAYARN